MVHSISGLELEYQVDETGPGHARVYHCRVRYGEYQNNNIHDNLQLADPILLTCNAKKV